MSLSDVFPEIVRPDEPLAPHTWLKVGGPAQYFVEPTSEAQLAAVLRHCRDEDIPVRVLGGGSNVLVRDEGVGGAVIHLVGEAFQSIRIEQNRVVAGAGALLSHVISETVRAGLAGLETLVGIPGTVGGAVKGNAGGRAGEIGQFVRRVVVLDRGGERFVREGDELTFGYRTSSIAEPVILEVELELQPGDPDQITQRMRKLWIQKRATQPLAHQSAGCIFKNPRGMSAGDLIERAGLKGTRIGKAEISDRHANFIVTEPGATSADVLRLIELARSTVAEQFGVELELEIQIW
ncbi:MAG: UDP-N-acetylmuramate dehydrogenase [Planctomycetota bacterium]|nr:MAG: UDP-N-acetylmuramate dehydrogenase [Planctomycetota bacterium]